MKMKRGLALIIVIGILGVLAVLATAFVAMAQLERRASEQRVNAARAYLLARSGIEDALARLELGQDPAYGGENWDGSADGLLSFYEASQEVYHRTGTGTPADVESCPVRQAMRPSFAAMGMGNPAVARVEGRDRGYSGVLAGDHASVGNTYALKVSSSNAGIYINGGALDDKDRDPDGPGAASADFPLNPNAAAEVAPLLPNKVPDHRDASMEGPNGFLVRLLNNLDAVVTNAATSNLGVQIVEARPMGGYKALDELKPVLGQARFDQFKQYLTLHAWVDPKVVKPQPMDGRPHRWEDIDDSHRIGTEAKEISGVHEDPTPFTVSKMVIRQKVAGGSTVTGQVVGGGKDVYVTATATTDLGPRLTLHPGIAGQGTEAAPWTQTITATNGNEGSKTYPVRWERNFVYAWSQLRLAPVAVEPRAPFSLNAASPEILASVFLGLRGTYLEVWEGSAGWDGGFGWFSGTFGYPYPSQATEEAPWHRTRVDYGMTYGTATGSPPARPWYGPADYDPYDRQSSYDPVSTPGGTPVIQSAPLGRLKETSPLTRAQAKAVADEAREVMVEIGPFRTWQQFNAFVTRLPRWEDVNDDGILDGAPYPVVGSGGAYVRRIYQREDANSDFLMQRETFTPKAGASWKDDSIAWEDPQRPRSGLLANLPGPGSDQVPGLTFVQRDVLRAMANPNTDLNDFNPDGNLWKEVDKTDLAGIRNGPSSYAHTTELSLDDSAGFFRIRAVGRVVGRGGQLLALRQAGALVKLGDLYRDTAQADFMKAYHAADQATLRAEEEAEVREREEMARYKAEREKSQDGNWSQQEAQARAEYKAQRKADYQSQKTADGQPVYTDARAEEEAESDATNVWGRQGAMHYYQQERRNYEEDSGRGEEIARKRSGLERSILGEAFSAAPTSYPLSGGQPLLSYPEPQRVGAGRRGADAAYDGQLSLGLVGPVSIADWQKDETLRGDLFSCVDAVASADLAVPDLRGPRREPLLVSAGAVTGNAFPDGVYSEKNRALKFRMRDTLDYSVQPNGTNVTTIAKSQIYTYDVFYVGCWAKANWFPETSPRAHALLNLSSRRGGWDVSLVPVDEIPSNPAGLYFVPARNNFWQDQMQTYVHAATSTQGQTWPCRSLLWGIVHSLWASDDLNRRGILEAPSGTRPVGRLEAHRWVHLAVRGAHSLNDTTMLILGRKPASQDGGGWNHVTFNRGNSPKALPPTHRDDTDNHLRFGEISGLHSMNYAADATFANVRAGRYVSTMDEAAARSDAYPDAFTGTSSPAALGRYYKEPWAAYASTKLPEGIRLLRATWTEVPCDLWFDRNEDGWLGDPATRVAADIRPDTAVGGVHVGVQTSDGDFSYLNDQFGPGGTAGPNGLRDVHIELEVWDDRGTDTQSDDVRLARFDNPAAANRIPQPQGRLYYKAVFVNEWDPDTRANYPLDVTPFLDDVTIVYQEAGGPKVVAWQSADE